MNEKSGIVELAGFVIVGVIVLGALAYVVPLLYDVGEVGIDIDESGIEELEESSEDAYEAITDNLYMDAISTILSGLVGVALFVGGGLTLISISGENKVAKMVGMVMLVGAALLAIATVMSLFA